MQLTSRVIGNVLSIDIDGHITGMSEVATIRNVLNSNANVSTIEIVLSDALVIPSALIGLLVKEINVGNKRVVLKPSKQQLKNLMTELNLNSIIDIR